MPYIPVPVETEPIDLAEGAYAYIQDNVAGWTPAAAGLEEILVEALAQFAGELRDLVQLVPDSIFQFFGSTILGLDPYPATNAYGLTTWTMIDLNGYRVNSGTLVAVEPPASTDSFAFEVVDDFVIPSGNRTIEGVQIRALEAGAAASGITGDVEMIDPLDFVQSVVLEGATSGGQDAEATSDYLDRLSDLLTLLSPRPILPQDFALLAQRMVPGIARATAIDLYNADTGETDCPRCVTVAVIGPDGELVSPAVKQQVDDLLQSMREVNFLVFVIDPTFTEIDVTWQATVFPGYDPAEVAPRVTDALTAYLSPENWGVPPFGDTGTQSWINTTAVRFLELSQVINEVEGVNFVTLLTLGLHGQAQSDNDIALAGPAPMPQPGTINGNCIPS